MKTIGYALVVYGICVLICIVLSLTFHIDVVGLLAGMALWNGVYANVKASLVESGE